MEKGGRWEVEKHTASINHHPSASLRPSPPLAHRPAASARPCRSRRRTILAAISAGSAGTVASWKRFWWEGGGRAGGRGGDGEGEGEGAGPAAIAAVNSGKRAWTGMVCGAETGGGGGGGGGERRRKAAKGGGGGTAESLRKAACPPIYPRAQDPAAV
jgi:hypothetical protein